ncbi:Rec8 like protein-domain-containing protein [Xylariomycetidae sp. FL0641]|nr:Rec8 like protein-domain-containing protein [Xylariomycetidae sp. FL0641]
MFYSHEILTSRQYGVATIWLVATIGNKSSTRKVSRKAIQDVDVQKACGKIIEPGAPIALRLQGNLLYGVSRVYNQQCSYMLIDAQKIQHTMHLFFSKFGGNHIDPEAAQARAENLNIMDDPDFVPDFQLPQLDLEALLANRASTQKTSSQMSPPDFTQLSGSASPGRHFQIQLDVAQSDSSGPRGSPFGLQGLSPQQKHEDEPMIFTQEDEFAGAGDWGLEIDENGNIIEQAELVIVQDEPELPPLPRPSEKNQEPRIEDQRARHENFEAPVVDENGDLVMMDEPLPEADPLPDSDIHSAFQDDQHPRRVPAQRKRKVRALLPDEKTQTSREVIRAWQTEYLHNCGPKAHRTVTPAQAKRNAMLLTFGLGLGNIGQNLGVPGMVHPLAATYSGDSLFTAITGLKILEQARGMRRSASESVAQDDEEKERRVRPRLDIEEEQQGRDAEGEDVFAMDTLADQTVPEVGREAEHPMSEDHPPSSVIPMPWNRGSSAVPGSSLRGPGSAQRGRDLSSPLGKRGDPSDIVRYSDDGGMGLGSDLGAGGLGSGDSSFDGLAVEPAQAMYAEDPVAAKAALDIEGRNFLEYVEEAATGDGGERRRDDDDAHGRRWVALDDLLPKSTTTKATITQAFYHTLALATKARLWVEQEEIYGQIWIGVKVPGSV